MIGTPVGLSTRGSEYLGEGNAQKYSAHQDGNRPMASQYRLGQPILDFPNKFVGTGKMRRMPIYEQWKRSRHAKTVRFPGEHPEVDNDLKKKLYGSEASILPDGITADVIYATIGTPRTKYGYIDGWLVRVPTNARVTVWFKRRHRQPVAGKPVLPAAGRMADNPKKALLQNSEN